MREYYIVQREALISDDPVYLGEKSGRGLNGKPKFDKKDLWTPDIDRAMMFTSRNAARSTVSGQTGSPFTICTVQVTIEVMED